MLPLLRTRRLHFFFALLGAGAVMAFSSIRAAPGLEDQKKLNGGYYLLHKVCDDETKVPLLLSVKHAPAEISSYADRIAKTAETTLKSLDDFQRRDSSIQFDRNPLPGIEQDVRDSIKADKQHQLLFGTTDTEFVRAFLVSQIEACTYALNLGKVLADREVDPHRVRSLQHESDKWLAARNEAFRLLRNY